MPIVAADIVFRLSGGASNTDPNAALGGAMSTVAGGIITTDVINNLWDDVSGAEASAGDVEYRCIYVENACPTAITLQNAAIWISADTTSADDEVDIGLDTAGLNGTAEIEADESTAPTNPTFSHPTTFATGLSLGNMAQNDNYPVWIERTVTGPASAANANPYTLSVQGETAA